MTEKKTKAAAEKKTKPAAKAAAKKTTATKTTAATKAAANAKTVPAAKKSAAKVDPKALGHVSQVMGAVVDVKIEKVDELPNIMTALVCDNRGQRLV